MAGVNARNEILALEMIRSELEANTWRRLIFKRPCNVVAASTSENICVDK
jgi:hypothetical protein